MAFHLKCMAGEFARALSLVSQVSGKEKQVPILRAIKIEVGATAATLIATNTDHAARVDIAADGNGTAYIEAALLVGKAAALRQSQPVEITADDEGKFVSVVQGKTRWKVPLLDGSGFPSAFTTPGKGKKVEIQTAPLFHAFTVVREAITQGIAFSYDMGALLDMDDGFRAVGTNGKVLAVVQLDAPALPVSIVVPNDAMTAMQALFRDADAIQVAATKDMLAVESDGIWYKTKLIEMPYPDWRRARDKASGELDGSATVALDEFVGTIDRAAAITETRTKDGAALAIKVSMADGEMSITSRNSQIGEEGADVCEYSGEHGGGFTTSGPNLKRMLTTMPGNAVRMAFHTSDPEKAAVLYAEPPGELDNYRIVMPMRA